VILAIRRLGALYVLYEKESSPATTSRPENGISIPHRAGRRGVHRYERRRDHAAGGDGTRLLE
jgi:hypothetical protein